MAVFSYRKTTVCLPGPFKEPLKEPPIDPLKERFETEGSGFGVGAYASFWMPRGMCLPRVFWVLPGSKAIHNNNNNNNNNNNPNNNPNNNNNNNKEEALCTSFRIPTARRYLKP